MRAFLLSGTLGFMIYQCLAWANVPKGRPALNIGHISIRFTGRTVVWVRRGLRLILAVLILGVLILGVLNLTNPPFLASDAFAKSEVAILLGAFWGPLFAIWINTVIANSAGADLTRAQFVAGVGLCLLFLIGSFGNETGSLLKQYAKKISNLKIAGAELSFSDRSRAGSPGAGALPPPGIGLVSGSAGLTYLAGLDEIIERDEKYIDLFRRVELRNFDDEVKLLGQASDSARRQQLMEMIKASEAQWEKTRSTLDTSKAFARAITKPLNCLVGWYEVTGDTVSINRHLASYGDLFRRVQAIDSESQIDDIANGLVRVLILMGSDVVGSVPSALIGDRCNKLFEQFCPRDLADHNRQPLRQCLKRSLDATTASSGSSAPLVENFRKNIALGLQKFVDTDGIDGRPYFVVGYASILTQLGQYTSAAAVLDGWLQKRPDRRSAKTRWAVAEDWFDIRARSMLAAYMEEWVRSYRAQPPPTNVLNEHIENLNIVLEYLEARLPQRDFSTKVMTLADLFSWTIQPKNTKIAFAKPKSSDCKFNGADFKDGWRRLFESYVSLRLTRVQATLLHFDYPGFAKPITQELAELAGMDLSCISDPDSQIPWAADIYAAQILESFARNAMLYTELHAKSESEDNKNRLTEAVNAAEFGQKLLRDAKKLEDKEEAKSAASRTKNFLNRIEAGEIAATQERLEATVRGLKKAQQDLD